MAHQFFLSLRCLSLLYLLCISRPADQPKLNKLLEKNAAKSPKADTAAKQDASQEKKQQVILDENFYFEDICLLTLSFVNWLQDDKQPEKEEKPPDLVL